MQGQTTLYYLGTGAVRITWHVDGQTWGDDGTRRIAAVAIFAQKACFLPSNPTWHSSIDKTRVSYLIWPISETA